jgi:hypothetical protein
VEAQVIASQGVATIPYYSQKIAALVLVKSAWACRLKPQEIIAWGEEEKIDLRDHAGKPAEQRK